MGDLPALAVGLVLGAGTILGTAVILGAAVGLDAVANDAGSLLALILGGDGGLTLAHGGDNAVLDGGNGSVGGGPGHFTAVDVLAVQLDLDGELLALVGAGDIGVGQGQLLGLLDLGLGGSGSLHGCGGLGNSGLGRQGGLLRNPAIHQAGLGHAAEGHGDLCLTVAHGGDQTGIGDGGNGLVRRSVDRDIGGVLGHGAGVELILLTHGIQLHHGGIQHHLDAGNSGCSGGRCDGFGGGSRIRLEHIGECIPAAPEAGANVGRHQHNGDHQQGDDQQQGLVLLHALPAQGLSAGTAALAGVLVGIAATLDTGALHDLTGHGHLLGALAQIAANGAALCVFGVLGAANIANNMIHIFPPFDKDFPSLRNSLP